MSIFYVKHHLRWLSSARITYKPGYKSCDHDKFNSSHWLKLQHSEWSNLVKDFFLQINFPPMRALEFIRDHVTFKLPYDFSYQMKNPLVLG